VQGMSMSMTEAITTQGEWGKDIHIVVVFIVFYSLFSK